jgi:hypothetical protein
MTRVFVRFFADPADLWFDHDTANSHLKTPHLEKSLKAQASNSYFAEHATGYSPFPCDTPMKKIPTSHPP